MAAPSAPASGTATYLGRPRYLQSAGPYRWRVELLERDRALAALAEAHAVAARGSGRAVVVSGEPGIGKTALVTRFTRDLDATGAVGRLRRPLDPTPAWPVPRPRRRCRARACERPGGRRGTARDPVAADRRAGRADRAGPRGPALGGRRDARRHHRARAADRRAARAARAHASAAARCLRRIRCTPRSAPSPARRRSSSSTRSRRAPWPLWRATTARAVRADGREPVLRHPSCSPRSASELPPSVGNAVLGRAARLDDAARRLVELVSVVPHRVSTGVLDAVMPDWADRGGAAGAPAAARGPARARELPARAGAARDPRERADRAPAAASRGDPGACSWRATAIRPRSSTTPRRRATPTSWPSTRWSPRGARRRWTPTARRTRTSPGRPTSRTGCRRCSRRRSPRSWPRPPTTSTAPRPRSRPWSAASRSTGSSATSWPSGAARGSCRASTGTRATATRPAAPPARRSRSSSARASRSSWPAPTAASPSSRCSPSSARRRSPGVGARLRSPPGSATSRPARMR